MLFIYLYFWSHTCLIQLFVRSLKSWSPDPSGIQTTDVCPGVSLFSCPRRKGDKGRQPTLPLDYFRWAPVRSGTGSIL